MMRGFILLLLLCATLVGKAQGLSAYNLIAIATCADSACYKPILAKQGFEKSNRYVDLKMAYYTRRYPACLGQHVDSSSIGIDVFIDEKQTLYVVPCDTLYKLLSEELKVLGYDSVMSVDDVNAPEKRKQEFTQRYYKSGSPVAVRIEGRLNDGGYMNYLFYFLKT